MVNYQNAEMLLVTARNDNYKGVILYSMLEGKNMITEISICYDFFSTEELEKILQNDLHQGDTPFLSTDAILHICEILWKRRPIADPEYETRKREFWKQLYEKYFDIDEDDEKQHKNA